MSKEEFNKLWKDSTKEQILNQYYYDYEEMIKSHNIINELEKYIHNELILDFYDEDMPCELIINKMENMINELKGDSSNE